MSSVGNAIVERELTPDFDETARMASRAFGHDFSASHLEWLYDRAFSQGAIIIAARHEGRKVGQLAMVRQSLRVGGEIYRAALVVDQCVEREYRSAPLVIRLYRSMREQCRLEDIRFLMGMPNERARPVVERFCQAPPHQRLTIRVGLSVASARSVEVSGWLDRLGGPASAALFDEILRHDRADGVAWTGPALVSRLAGGGHRFAFDATANTLVISRAGKSRGVPATIVVGCFVTPGVETAGRELAAAVASACRRNGRPLFAYAGINPALKALPGFDLPDAFRPSPLTLHLRDETGLAPPRLDRYELIDFDYA